MCLLGLVVVYLLAMLISHNPADDDKSGGGVARFDDIGTNPTKISALGDEPYLIVVAHFVFMIFLVLAFDPAAITSGPSRRQIIGDCEATTPVYNMFGQVRDEGRERGKD